MLGTAALIFVAYEGFELLTYDYEAIEDHHRNLPRATVISVLAVLFLYVLVAFVTTAALPDSVIKAHNETVLAYVAQPVLGQVGVTAVMIAAVLSTASAINATVFATARLANRFSEHGQLPSVLTRFERGGVPVLFVVVSALGAMALQLLGSLERIVSFASLVFLAVFAIVNLAAFVHKTYRAPGGCCRCWARWAARGRLWRCWSTPTARAATTSTSSSASPSACWCCGGSTC